MGIYSEAGFVCLNKSIFICWEHKPERRKLSDRRTKVCADYLKQRGLESGRISFVSFGECCPVEMELIYGRDNPDGRSKNRRTLINISKEE